MNKDQLLAITFSMGILGGHELKTLTRLFFSSAEDKFGEPTPEQTQVIQSVNDPELFKTILSYFPGCSSWDELLNLSLSSPPSS